MATENITSISDINEWILACNAFEQCEIQSLKQDVSFIESELIPTTEIEQNNMHFISFEPRIFKGDGINNLWVYINKKDILRKRPYTIDINALLHDGHGNPIDSLKGAIDMHDADVHDIPVNEYFHRHTGVSDILVVASAKGDTSITVNLVVLFNIGNNIQIQNGVIETTFPQITDIVGNVLTLDRPLDYAFSVGDTVEVVTFEMNVLGTLANPVAFRLIPNGDELWHIVRFLLGIIHSSTADDSLFGNIAALSNGVVLRGYNASLDQYRTFTVWKKNGDIKMDMFDVLYTDKAGGGLFGTNARGSVKIGTGAVPKLNGANEDYMEILIQDNLTGLTSLRLKGQGHIEGI